MKSHTHGFWARLVVFVLLASRATPILAAENTAPAPTPAVPQVEPPKTKDHVRITLQTVPPRRAVVKWGKKTLGVIPAPQPLIVVRPRDSGPLDIVIRMTGYLPVHTRAYTFSDSRVAVKLTPVSQKHTLFGYRQEPPPEDANAPDPSAPVSAPELSIPAQDKTATPPQPQPPTR